MSTIPIYPSKRVSELPQIAEAPATSLLAVAVPNPAAPSNFSSYKMTFEDLTKLLAGEEVYGTFNQTNLVGGVLEITHPHLLWFPACFAIYDNNDFLVLGPDSLQISMGKITIDFSTMQPLIGDWHYYGGDVVTSGGLSAPGADTEIVFNQLGGVSASSNFTYNYNTDTLGIGAIVDIYPSGVDAVIQPQQNAGSLILMSRSALGVLENELTIDEGGITLNVGATISEFSTDGTFALPTDTKVSTMLAVKTYVDASIGTVSSFSDAAFSVYNEADNTKSVSFITQYLTTGTPTTLTFPPGDVSFYDMIANTAYRQVGHLPLSGGNMSGHIGMNGNRLGLGSSSGSAYMRLLGDHVYYHTAGEQLSSHIFGGIDYFPWTGLTINKYGIQLSNGAQVDNIETSLTDDDTHIPTSGAVYAAIAAIVDPPVTKIIAGTNVTISPTSGLGNVTINATGGGVTAHSALTGLTTPGAHPTAAITGLDTALAGKLSTTGKAADSALLNGVAESDAAGNSTIVKRSASGYIYANYFNTTASVYNNSPADFMGTRGTDGFIRRYSPASAREGLGLHRIQVDFFISGNYGDGIHSMLLREDMGTTFIWRVPDAQLISVYATHKVPDSSTTEAQIRVNQNGSYVSTAFSLSGAAWSQEGTTSVTGATITAGQVVDIGCSLAGGNGDAEDLTVTTIWEYV